MSKKGFQKQFCIWGHDTFVCGRDKWHQCRDCGKKESRIYYNKNRLKLIARSIQWQKENPEKVKQINSADKRKKYVADYNKQHVLEKRKWVQNHKALCRLIKLHSKTERSLRIPIWGQEGILEFYINCPEDMVVDHIVPLCGKEVSGLHILSNLQYLTPHENSVKHNKWDGTLENNSWRKNL